MFEKKIVNYPIQDFEGTFDTFKIHSGEETKKVDKHCNLHNLSTFVMWIKPIFGKQRLVLNKSNPYTSLLEFKPERDDTLNLGHPCYALASECFTNLEDYKFLFFLLPFFEDALKKYLLVNTHTRCKYINSFIKMTENGWRVILDFDDIYQYNMNEIKDLANVFSEIKEYKIIVNNKYIKRLKRKSGYRSYYSVASGLYDLIEGEVDDGFIQRAEKYFENKLNKKWKFA